MKPSTFLRRLSASSAVAPLPVQTKFDQKVTKELDNLQSQGSEYASAAWLIQAFEASITTQKITLESLSNVMLRDSDRKVTDEYLDNSVEMLDACNNISEKLETMKTYVDSLKGVAKILEGQCEPNPTCLARANDLLDSCDAFGKRSCTLKKPRSKSKKLNQKVGQQHGFELGDILAASNAVASMMSGVLESALTLKSTRGFPTTQIVTSSSTWTYSLSKLQNGMKNGSVMLIELRETVKAAKNLRDQIKNKRQNGQLKPSVVELKQRCIVLEKVFRPLEKSVEELYKHLISVRMALLGMISKA